MATAFAAPAGAPVRFVAVARCRVLVVFLLMILRVRIRLAVVAAVCVVIMIVEIRLALLEVFGARVHCHWMPVVRSVALRLGL